MPNTTFRLVAERYRDSGTDRRWRKIIAIALVVITVAAAVTVFRRDVDWESRNNEARRLGLVADRNGNFNSARRHYENALANDPYDWETHFDLANILMKRLNDLEGALRHFLYTLAYAPEPAVIEAAERDVRILRLIRSGHLENPQDALNDLYMAAEARTSELFAHRLSVDLRDDSDAYWRGWTSRGRGTVTLMRISDSHDGFFDAYLELEFSDETSMSMHMKAPIRDIWRIRLSFP
ncbi:MAG: hypothetical protein LUG50_03230 [Planctomycetaceae bacterium]|nr:hypothetical protein [Planctomycetaceae bacterium]